MAKVVKNPKMKTFSKFILASASFLGGLVMITDSKIQAKISHFLPSFISSSRVLNAQITCSGVPRESRQLTQEESKYRDLVWEEAMVYLRNIAVAATTTDRYCRNSDIAVFETGRQDASKPRSMCLMDREDSREMINNIYAIISNQIESKKCFSLNKESQDVFSPGGLLLSQSKAALSLERKTLSQFFKDLQIPDVREHGLVVAENFSGIVTGDKIQTPSAFPSDISANSLPNLWASVGWIPMYAKEDSRFHNNQPSARGGFVYAEVLGSTGLIRIKSINGMPMRSEIGMTVQKLDSFYTFHTHDATEIYYNLKKPSCDKQIEVFAMREGNLLLKTVQENDHYRIVEFDAGLPSIKDNFWMSASPVGRDLTYFHENTIHALKLSSECSRNPEKSGAVAVWSRTRGFDKNNSNYSKTNICESAKREGYPADRDELVRCKLYKWQF